MIQDTWAAQLSRDPAIGGILPESVQSASSFRPALPAPQSQTEQQNRLFHVLAAVVQPVEVRNGSGFEGSLRSIAPPAAIRSRSMAGMMPNCEYTVQASIRTRGPSAQARHAVYRFPTREPAPAPPAPPFPKPAPCHAECEAAADDRARSVRIGLQRAKCNGRNDGKENLCAQPDDERERKKRAKQRLHGERILAKQWSVNGSGE